MNLLPDASMLVILVIFWITYWILKKFLFQPIVEILRERRETVETARAEHVAAPEQADTKIDAEREKLNRARVEAAARRDELRKAAEDHREAVLGETREETDARLRAAQAELEAEVATQRKTLETQARALAGRISDKLLERSA
jgi:F-type H+-transporting ATPase subunit b